MSACAGRREPGKIVGLIKEIGQVSEKRYLPKSAFSDTSEEYEMEKVDICVKVDDL